MTEVMRPQRVTPRRLVIRLPAELLRRARVAAALDDLSLQRFALHGIEVAVAAAEACQREARD